MLDTANFSNANPRFSLPCDIYFAKPTKSGPLRHRMYIERT